MKPPLRVAAAEPLSSIEMAEAIEALGKECAAAQPVAVLIVWEISSKREGETTIVCRSVPDSAVLRRGMVDVLFDQHHPEPVE